MGIKSERFGFAFGVIENEEVTFSGMHDRFDIRTRIGSGLSTSGGEINISRPAIRKKPPDKRSAGAVIRK